jgi:hypothetical protein
MVVVDQEVPAHMVVAVVVEPVQLEGTDQVVLAVLAVLVLHG